ncbi:MAG: hypothetical protein IT457_01410 [Planctomycetes bacterium]|nr:hypothetical protein [Planctomycetota bacterium]
MSRRTRTTLAVLATSWLAACTAVTADPERAAGRFPEDWLGTWQGQLRILGPEGERDRIDVELEIAVGDEPSRWNWTLVYSGRAGRSERPYQLLARNPAEGTWAIDERNGIVIEARLLDGTFHCCFDVGSARILWRQTLLAAGTPHERVELEILAASTVPVATAPADGRPEATSSWPPHQVQRAVLRRRSGT